MWRPELQLVAGQAQVSGTEQGWIVGKQLKRSGLQLEQEQAQGLKLGWGPNLAFVLGQVEGLTFVFGLRLRESSGHVQRFWLELESTSGFEESEVQGGWQ